MGARLALDSPADCGTERREPVEPWSKASCSSRLERDVQEFGGRFTMFKAFGNDSKGQCLHARDGFVPVSSVAHHARELRYLGEPSAIAFPFKLDGQRHVGTLAPGQQSNNRLEPTRSRFCAIMSPNRAAQAETLDR
jgi:hypothetical protein